MCIVIVISFRLSVSRFLHDISCVYDYVVLFPRNLSNVSFFACRTCICICILCIYILVCVRACVRPPDYVCVCARAFAFSCTTHRFRLLNTLSSIFTFILAAKIFCLIFYVDWPNTVELLNWRDDNYLLFISCIIFFVRLFVFLPVTRPFSLCMHSTMEMIILILLILNKLWIGRNDMNVGHRNNM